MWGNKMLKKKDILNIISNYEIGDLVDYVRMERGENINFRIRTTKGTYHLKYYIQENSERRNWLLFELRAIDYLSKELPIPKIIPTKNGSLYTLYNNRFCVLYESLTGSVHYKVTPQVIVQIAQFLGKFHKLALKYDCKYKTPRGKFTPRTLYWILIRDVLPKCKNKKIRQELKMKSRFLYKMRYTHLPKGLIHMDIDPQNFIFENSKLKAMIDFGDALCGILLIDIARGIYEFCLESGTRINPNLVNLFLREYQKQRKLTKAEKEALIEFIKFAFIWKTIDLLLKNRIKEAKDRLRVLEEIDSLSNKLVV